MCNVTQQRLLGKDIAGMSYKAIIFDYDGTIADTERVVYRCWREVFREHGQDLPLSEWAQVVGAATDAVDPYQMLEAKLGTPVDREAVAASRRALEKELLTAEPMRPGVRELILEAHRHRFRLAVASNSPARWVYDGLSLYGIAHLFHTVCTPDDGVSPKPAPDLYLLAAQRLAVAPSEAIAVEDSPHGAAAALAGGLACVVVPSELTADRGFPERCVRLATLEGVSLDRLLAEVRALSSL